ncbi:hypothetical protein [Ramlibacter sp. 2FC]|uniref:hypothetical protein n=1 Tax=Ramlibacter sp. 2FC TaxID=2502188 RepID=UPI00148550F9|nr:hypothetical protein [Ramlibacter sp. 2FC]
MKVAGMPASTEDFCGPPHAAKLLGLSVGAVQLLVEMLDGLQQWTGQARRRVQAAAT